MPASANARRRTARPRVRDGAAPVSRPYQVRKIAANFLTLGAAEVLCRTVSVVVTLTLARRLDTSGFGRVEFAFNLVFWLVLIVRDCFETVITREIARHPRLTRGLVNHVLAAKLALAVSLFGALSAASLFVFSEPVDRGVLIFYGLLLLTTALGLDFVFRGTERMAVVAVSLLLRTAVYCGGVWYWVNGPSRVLLVPLWLACGEATGIALVWGVYAREYGWPRPVLGLRCLRVLWQRGRSVGLIHLCQAVIVSSDLLVVGVMSRWSDVGRYGAPHRMVSAVMAFGMIFQQVVFPALSRNWRASPEACRRLLDLAVRVLVSGFVPVAVGASLLAGPLVAFLLPPGYRHAGVLLAVGVWKAPLLCLAFLYQSALIATNREAQGLRLLAWGAVCSAPLVALFQWRFGLPGAALAVVVIGAGLVGAGYYCLARGPCRPSAHHHLGRPLCASAVMVPVCLFALKVHVLAAVLMGGLTYLLVMGLIGGWSFPAVKAEVPG